ncbi:MAG: FtsW/RodA/SpoVE family cell cycle protein, partial [Actinobacteria bacterium]|nr:FtsW/RodA/SpoVE family cell cycle protein [Actinomycetota bacterium]
WLDPFAYADGSGYQLIQALYSMADGGLFGTGIGRGMPTKIPVVESDFIFAAIAEEMGLLGASGILLLFILFAIRGFVTAARAKSDVSAFCAVGLTAAISLQAFVIVGGVTRLIPLTGLTLPFMSQGGSSLLASFIIVGLLLRAGDEGTGIETEMQGTATLDGGVLGRSALGKRLTQLVAIVAVLFALLIANLTYIQIVKADEYRSMPSNNHTLAKTAQSERGAILSSDNVVLAQSVLSDDGVTYTRVYPSGTLASHVLGYASTQYGLAGVEASANESLTGSSDFASWSDAIRALAGSTTSGNDVVLTIDSTIQAAAEAALEGEVGAIVALDPETGAVLALASSPTYDPGDISALLDGSTESDALYNRATQALYAPGSTFKIVTLATALETGIATADTVYSSPGVMEIGGGEVTNFEETSHGDITLTQATAVSSNTVFGQVAVQIGAENLVKYSEKFGINDKLGQDFTVTNSLMPIASEMTEWETAWTGVGQPVGEHESPAGPQVTVMQMALIGSAIANDGVAMNPYLVEKVMTPEGLTVSTTSAQVYGTVVSSSTARKTIDILAQAIAGGSGGAAKIEGVNVAGKTGTAETNKEQDDAWFVGMAPAEDPKVVIAVIIEEGGTGGGTAAPKAKLVMEAALKAYGIL